MKKVLFFAGMLLMSGVATMNAQEQQTENPNDFALRFFEKVIEAKKDSSVITAPLGVSFVLGMLDSGAAGQTAQEIDDALGVEDATMLADRHNKLMATFPTLDEKTEFGIANAIILNSAKGYSFLPTYTQQMQDKYEALMKNMDFEDDATLKYINNWCAEKTKDMIPEILRQLNPDMVSLLMNALYFKGIWTKTFDPEWTGIDFFRTANGASEEIAMMCAYGSYPYASNDVFKTVRLDYGNGSYSMYVMLPHGEHTIADILTEMKTTDWMGAPVMTDDLHLYLPQFSSQSNLDLKKILNSMGITTMFDSGKADFSRMMDLGEVEGNLYVSLFKQVAKIDVDENGTKAAAVTYAAVSCSSMPRNEFYANRPFLYAIVENTTSTICFMGQFTGKGEDASARPILAEVTNPEAECAPKVKGTYDMSGRRLSTLPGKGIYVIDGKKRVGDRMMPGRVADGAERER